MTLYMNQTKLLPKELCHAVDFATGTIKNLGNGVDTLPDFLICKGFVKSPSKSSRAGNGREWVGSGKPYKKTHKEKSAPKEMPGLKGIKGSLC